MSLRPERPPAASRRRTGAVLLAGVLVAGALLAPLAVLIRQTTASARRGLDERQASRTTLARQFVDTYVADLLSRVQTTAEVTVAGPAPTRADLEQAARHLQMDAAVLLDDDGLLLQIVPQRPELLQTRIIDRYPHLRAAHQGRAVISDVVPAAATGAPIVAFAAPIQTPHGRRVISGGFTIERTPLGAFLRNFSALAGSSVYLIDRSGQIVDSSVVDHRATLAEQDPHLAAALAATDRPYGTFAGASGDRYFSVERTTSAPWQLVYSVPSPTLYSSIASSSTMPWLLFTAFAVTALTSIVLVARVLHQRRRLLELAERDSLTGLYNRRYVDAELDQLARQADRDESPLAVLLIDIDHFKQINDTFGHHQGDDVLTAVAQALQANVRAVDTVSRWGGEEFMILAPHTSIDDAAALADRLRRAVSEAVGVDGTPVTVSVGCAVVGDDGTEAAAIRADSALYRAKAAGRNRVRADGLTLGPDDDDRPVSHRAALPTG